MVNFENIACRCTCQVLCVGENAVFLPGSTGFSFLILFIEDLFSQNENIR